jgi:hypothetical protein
MAQAERCIATTRLGKPCRNAPQTDLGVCHSHGGRDGYGRRVLKAARFRDRLAVLEREGRRLDRRVARLLLADAGVANPNREEVDEIVAVMRDGY